MENDVDQPDQEETQQPPTELRTAEEICAWWTEYREIRRQRETQKLAIAIVNSKAADHARIATMAREIEDVSLRAKR